MKREKLELAQMLNRHPILEEKEEYKIKYINFLEYFAKKYSNDDQWAFANIKLYINQLLDKPDEYVHCSQDIKKISRKVLSTKIRKFRFFSYRFAFLFDCMFINAFDDQKKADKIYMELETFYKKRHVKKLRLVYSSLYDSQIDVNGIDKIDYLRACWWVNRCFIKQKIKKILITANMSAGKSTLLNAIVGKKVNKTQNDACTAKTHYILRKAYEDGFSYEWDHELELDADYQILMEDNEENDRDEITVGTYFKSVKEYNCRAWFIDTPGVNSSQDEEHKQITERTLNSIDADILIYLLNGENIGTDDDTRHLQHIKEIYKGQIIFIVNKLDQYKKNEDSVVKTLEREKADLVNIGFTKPQVFPISSYAAYLAKMKLYGEQLNDDEEDEFQRLLRKLKKDEFQFNQYYPKEILHNSSIEIENDAQQLLVNSGILQLETMIYNK